MWSKLTHIWPSWPLVQCTTMVKLGNWSKNLTEIGGTLLHILKVSEVKLHSMNCQKLPSSMNLSLTEITIKSLVQTFASLDVYSNIEWLTNCVEIWGDNFQHIQLWGRHLFVKLILGGLFQKCKWTISNANFTSVKNKISIRVSRILILYFELL